MSQGVDVKAAAPATHADLRPGIAVVAIMLCIYGGLALSIDYPKAAVGFKGDDATYYMMGHSLAKDWDITYRAEDLQRVWREFSSGPTGVFLKKGKDIRRFGLMLTPPFFWTSTSPDPDQSRLYYGKSFVYPLAAAPFVRLFGSNGFLVFNALLLALVVWCGFLFLQTRMPPATAAAFAAGFVMASVVPVYAMWVVPELFNLALGVVAYFCWLYKEVATPSRAGRGTGWLFGPASDVVAAGLIGVATFSKISNALLVFPILAWLLWKRGWRPLVMATLVFGIAAVGLFALNLGSAGEWNYQGGERKSFYFEYPFQTAASSFDATEAAPKSRDEALFDVIFDSRVFWLNLRSNLWYFVVGRYTGLLPYFFPGFFAVCAFLAAPRRRPAWQYLVLASAVAQALLFIITQPYTWSGSGGSIGNRYFMGAYGLLVFVLPPIERAWLAVVPWIVGGLFTASMVLNPFVTLMRPSDYAKTGPARWLPLELTEINDLPVRTDNRIEWLGDVPGPHDRDLRFQVYFLDERAYGREEDKSFWVKGESRTELVIKTDRAMKRLVLDLSAGPVATDVKASVAGRSQRVSLAPGGSQRITFALPPGFWYQARAFEWIVSISSSGGFTPIFFDPQSTDPRYLGVRVKPTVVE